MKFPINQIIQGDCLEIMPKLQDKSINMVLCDLPYGTTYASWDSIIPFDKLWEEYKRLIKDNGALVFTSSQPFTTTLINSNLDWFRYEWIWDKHHPTNFFNVKHQPLKQHENIVVFSRGKPLYYPVMSLGKLNHTQGKSKSNISETRLISKRSSDNLNGFKYPKSILYFPKHSSQVKFHPTQKPIRLLEYLIKTYTKENDIVLDNCIGSGSTTVAAKNINRRYIGIEIDPEYVKLSKKRLAQEVLL